MTLRFDSLWRLHDEAEYDRLLEMARVVNGVGDVSILYFGAIEMDTVEAK